MPLAAWIFAKQRPHHSLVVLCLAFLASLILVGCSNDPFPSKAKGLKVRHIPFSTAPKTLDPAVAYTAGTTYEILNAVYEPLLSYHYLKRPYQLIPGIAKEVPDPIALPDGKVKYVFNIHTGLRFHEDPCFKAHGQKQPYREATIYDVVYQIHRLADRRVLSPVINNFVSIEGFSKFSDALDAKRKVSPAFEALPAHKQYEGIGGIKGLATPNESTLEITLSKPFPQLLYWLATPFIAPVPWEAVEYYDGKDGRDHFRDHPVGTGPYDLVHYDKEYKIVLDKTDDWWGSSTPSPFTRYPSEGEATDKADGFLSDVYVNKPLGFIERYEFRRDKESTSQFGKFMQGYYDASGIDKERFDTIIVGSDLSPEMESRGITLRKSLKPATGYLGFNMADTEVGHAGGDKAKYLRQAMSLVIDADAYREIFSNGRNIPANSPIPPGLFGYDKNYVNPYRVVDIEKAKSLLGKAGYANGIDPKTNQPLKLSFDVIGTSSAALLGYEFYTSAWRKIGLNVEINGTNYNQFSEKVKKNAYQIFSWGWVADYPDPENFLFLLYSKMGVKDHNGPNTANYNNPKYDALFEKMKTRKNDEQRLAFIKELKQIIQEDCPWIPLLHSESYSLSHAWLKNNKPFGMMAATMKFQDLDVSQKESYINKHNAPITWPAYAALIGFIAVIIPAIGTYMRERQ